MIRLIDFFVIFFSYGKVDIIGSAVSFSSAIPTTEFSMWFKTNGDLLIDALANGYEADKEPTIHELKILPEYFEADVSGDVHVAKITYIKDYAQQDSYVVMGIK